MAQLLSVNSGLVAGLSGRRWGRKLDSADRPNVAPEEFKRQENKQAFWSQRAHSLSLTLFLSFTPSLPLPLYLSSLVSPLLTSIFLSSSKNLSLCLSSLHFFSYHICKSRTERQTSIKKRQTHHLTSQGADRQTDTEKHRQGPPYSTNILSWCRAEEHDMENVTPSLVFKKKKKKQGLRETFPSKHFLLSRTCSLLHFYSSTGCAWQCFLMHADGPVSKGLSLYSSVVETACWSLWVWLCYHLPPQACFPFSKQARFPQIENTWLWNNK